MSDRPPDSTSTPRSSRCSAAGDPPELIQVRLRVPLQFDGWRLDHFIKARIPRLSRARIQKMIGSQQDLGGQPMKPSTRVKGDAEVVLLRPAPVEPDVPRSFELIYEDAAVIAINKPAGLPVHATARFHKNTLTAVLREHFAEAGRSPPILAHRLDRETSGVMLLGASKPAAVALKSLFRQRRVEKRYLAIVVGQAPDHGSIDLPLGPDLASGIRIKMCAVQSGGLPSRTRYRSIETRDGFTLVEAFPETGRQHQIRAHLAALGYPVVGDKLYGQDPDCFFEFLETGWSRRLEQRLLLPRQALHAADVALPHPTTGAPLRISCAMPPDLRRFWDKLAAPQR